MTTFIYVHTKEVKNIKQLLQIIELQSNISISSVTIRVISLQTTLKNLGPKQN